MGMAVLHKDGRTGDVCYTKLDLGTLLGDIEKYAFSSLESFMRTKPESSPYALVNPLTGREYLPC